MIIVGLTGGIGSGKTTVAKHLKKLKIPVFESDYEVSKFYKKKDRELVGALRAIDENNKIIRNNRIYKKAIRGIIFKNDIKRKKLEKVIFKKLDAVRSEFIKKNKNKKKAVVILDTPLLFENKINRMCNYVIVVSAPINLRVKRVLRRGGMTKSLIKKIISKQMPENIKKKKSDFIVQTNKGKYYSYNKTKEVLNKILKKV